MSPPPPTRTFPPPSELYNRAPSKRSRDVIHRSNCVDGNDHHPSIDPKQPEENIEAPRVPSSSSVYSTPSRTTLQSTRHTKSSHYKHSLPHRRVLRSFPRLPHAFVQPSTNRYLPYIPISITVRQTVERHSIDVEENIVYEEQPGSGIISTPPTSSVAHSDSFEEVEEV
jgi:hypothetical protein